MRTKKDLAVHGAPRMDRGTRVPKAILVRGEYKDQASFNP